MTNELFLVPLALLAAAGIVWFIHRMVMRHLSPRNANNKVFIAMLEVVVLGTIIAAFVLGEVVAFADRVREAHASGAHFGVTFHDVALLLSSLTVSLLIFWTFSRLMQGNPRAPRAGRRGGS